MLVRISVLTMATSVVFGCGVVPPKVQYSEFRTTKADDGSIEEQRGYVFRHRRSVIQVKYSEEKKGLEATALPYELNTDNSSYGRLYQVKGADTFVSTTQLKISYLDNTKFVDQLQITTKDNIADTIAKIGEVLKTVAPILATAVKGTTTPGVRPFEPTLIDPTWPDVDKWKEDALNPTFCLRLRGQVAESSIRLEEFVSANRDKWLGSFPVPACSTGVVEVLADCTSGNKKEDQAPTSAIRVTFASADFVVPTSLPSTGTLKMNSVCGASVTVADKEDRYDMLTYLNSAIKQAQDTYSAWAKAKETKNK